MNAVWRCGHPRVLNGKRAFQIWSHPRGCPDCEALYNRIHHMNRYWFARLILGLGSIAANALSLGISEDRKRAQHRNMTRMWSRRTYRTLRAQGCSPYAAQARMRGTTPAQQRRLQIRYRRRYRAKWGGDPSKIGSPAWRRWMLAKAGEPEPVVCVLREPGDCG